MFNKRQGWIDYEGRLAEGRDAADAAERRRRDAEHAQQQANAPETIPPTGRHHRADGK